VQCVENAIKRRAFGRALRVTEALGTQRLQNIITNQKAD
jgi:predicted RNA-binding protein YlxR (DUF448 family)